MLATIVADLGDDELFGLRAQRKRTAANQLFRDVERSEDRLHALGCPTHPAVQR